LTPNDPDRDRRDDRRPPLSALAEPPPQPKVGTCPSGYGGYCAPMNDKAPMGRAEDRPMPERVHEIGGADCVHERVKLHLAQFAH
jgi:hypothetical protein